MVRLTSIEQNAITSTIKSFDSKASIFLFGSRTDLTKKGGDIDLLVLSEVLGLDEKIKILVEIKGIIGEQKIDLIIANREKIKSDPFLVHVHKESIQIS